MERRNQKYYHIWMKLSPPLKSVSDKMNKIFTIVLLVLVVVSVVLQLTTAAKDCSSLHEEGVCRGYFPKFYFDCKTNTCKGFIYGGCGGNNNRYDTIEKCKEACL
ncbi:SPINT3 (predicted) [Pycnogonum litorale]